MMTEKLLFWKVLLTFLLLLPTTLAADAVDNETDFTISTTALATTQVAINRAIEIGESSLQHSAYKKYNHNMKIKNSLSLAHFLFNNFLNYVTFSSHLMYNTVFLVEPEQTNFTAVLSEISMEFRMKYSDIEFNFKHMYLDRANSGHVKSDCEYKTKKSYMF